MGAANCGFRATARLHLSSVRIPTARAPRLRHKRLAVSGPRVYGCHALMCASLRGCRVAGRRVGISCALTRVSNWETGAGRRREAALLAAAAFRRVRRFRPAFAFDGSTSALPAKICPKTLRQRRTGPARRARRPQRRQRGVVRRRADLCGGGRPAGRPLEARRDVCRRGRRPTRRREGLPLFQPARSGLRRGCARTRATEARCRAPSSRLASTA